MSSLLAGIRTRLRSDTFTGNVLMLAGGATIGQVINVLATPVFWSVALMITPGTSAPEGSMTLPVRVPLDAAQSTSTALPSKSTAATMRHNATDFCKKSLKMHKPNMCT